MTLAQWLSLNEKVMRASAGARYDLRLRIYDLGADYNPTPFQNSDFHTNNNNPSPLTSPSSGTTSRLIFGRLECPYGAPDPPTLLVFFLVGLQGGRT